MTPDAEIDARGLLCPLPVLRARKRLIGMAPGQVLRLLASDPMAAIDLPHFCAEAGHEFLGAEPVAGDPRGAELPAPAQAYAIRRGAG